MPREEFDAWLEREARAQAAGTSSLGEETFNGVCAKCHGLAGRGRHRPAARSGNSLLDDAAAIEQLVRERPRPDAAGRQGLGTTRRWTR